LEKALEQVLKLNYLQLNKRISSRKNRFILLAKSIFTLVITIVYWDGDSIRQGVNSPIL